jgi:preprotein translocase subunit SecA
VTGMVTGATQDFSEDWDLEQLWTDLKQIWPVSLDYRHLEEEVGGTANLDRDHLIADLQKDAQAAYDVREQEVGTEVMRELERRVLLSVLDRKWREHLYEMDYLREGIYLRAYSQRDPLVEYQREGFEMFAAMMDGIKEESVGFLFNLEVSVEDEDGDGEDEVEIQEPLRRVIGDFVPDSDDSDDAVDADDPLIASGPAEQPNEELESPAAAFVRSPQSGPQIRAKGLQQQRQPQNLSYSAPSEGGEAEVSSGAVTTDDDPFAKVGRNAQCPCGSGKKYKMCHGRPGGPTGLTARAAGG